MAENNGSVERKDLRIISADSLDVCRLVRRDFLRRRAFLVEHIVDSHADTDRVSNMCDQVRPLDAQGERGVVDVVDEIVHLGRFEVHEAVDFGLGGGAGVAREGGGGAAEEEAEVGVEGCEESEGCVLDENW